jgi:hypothetical protein
MCSAWFCFWVAVLRADNVFDCVFCSEQGQVSLPVPVGVPDFLLPGLLGHDGCCFCVAC